MNKIEDFRDLIVLNELKDILVEMEGIIKESFINDGDSHIEDVWGTNNLVEVEDVPHIFDEIEGAVLDTHTLELHYTIKSSDYSFEDTKSRFILMDGLKPIYVTRFEQVIENKDGFYAGLKKEGVSAIIIAALKYCHLGETSIES